MPLRCALLFLAATTATGAQTAEEILSTFEIHPDFEIQLVAREPIVTDPVDMEFDEHGTPYVIEFPGYPDPEGANGAIVTMEDTDGDGIYDVRTVFADGFQVADAILPWRGGLLVASPPDLVFVKDSTGDGRADVREVLMSGFDVGNQQHNYNGLIHGLDNWIYGANGGNQGTPFWPESPDAPMPMRGDDFRLDLDAKIFERIGRSTGGFGLAFDTFGRLFETHNTVHISHLVFHGNYLDGVPAGRGGSLDWDISDHSEGSTARIYAIGEQETRVNHPEQSGYFSGACGVTYYGGGAFGQAFNGNLFVCDVVLNLIHRDVIVPNGASFEVTRGREDVEFLASTDRGFRPVNLSVGPDGAMYVMDMHRDVIEHPEWIPDEIEVNLDLEAGKDRGRIFRIVPKGGLPEVTPKFSRDDSDGLVAALAHDNKWWRDTAQRLIVEWDVKVAAPALRDMLQNHSADHARLHALWTLHHLDELDDGLLRSALADSSAGVRENAVHVAASRAEKNRRLRAALRELAEDSDPRVRMTTALVLGDALGVDAGDDEALITIARSDADDPWTRLALSSAFVESADHAIHNLLDDHEPSDGEIALAESVALMAARDANVRDLSSIFAAIPEWSSRVHVAVLDGIASGLALREGTFTAEDLSGTARETLAALVDSDSSSTARVSWRVAEKLGLPRTESQLTRIAAAIELAANGETDVSTRVEALRVAEFAPLADRESLLFDLVDPREPVPVQEAAMNQLRGANSLEVAARLIDRWQTLGPEARSIAANILLYQRHNHDQLLTALEDGRIALGQMNFDLERRRTLLHWSTDEIGARAAKLFTDAGVVTRKAALEAMRPAISLAGDSERGATIYAERCAKCHTIRGNGGEVGPSLDDIYRKSKETLLHDILDPNAGVETEYLSYTIELTSDDDLLAGEIVSGMIVGQDSSTITIRAAEQEDRVIPRSSIASMRGSGLSMMPEELEAGLEPQGMADLLAFLQQAP